MADGMINITVTFLGLLRDQMGSHKLELRLSDPARYQDLLDSLAPLAGKRLGDWAWDRKAGAFTDRVKVSRGSAIGSLGPDSQLFDGEEIIVFPPVAGG